MGMDLIIPWNQDHPIDRVVIVCVLEEGSKIIRVKSIWIYGVICEKEQISFV